MNIQDYVRLNDKGELETDNDAFQSMFTAEVNRAVEKYRNGKGKDEIRKQLEEEAKLTAEEKLKSEREAFEKYKLETKIEINRTKAKARLENKGFTEKEVDYLLSNINDDEEKSLGIIDTLIGERTAFIESTKKSAIESLQKGQQTSSNPTPYKPDNPEPAKPARRSSEDVLKYYRSDTQN